MKKAISRFAFLALVGLTVVSLSNCHNSHSSDNDLEPTIDVTGFDVTPESLVIEEYINRRAAKFDVVENKETRRIQKRDVNGDGTDEYIVVYMLEGFERTNLWKQFLTVFSGAAGAKTRPLAEEMVGTNNDRLVVGASVNSDGRIELKIRTYQDGDASCCPTLEGYAYFRVQGTTIIEVKAG